MEKDVEQALQKRDIDDLRKDLSDLKELVTEGFRGIHARQDFTNGKVEKNTRWRVGISMVLAFITVVILPIVWIAVKELVEHLFV